ncbi:hypothetical protein GOBAR_AA20244 [Gossypium barbadense]|uniref:Uncharacterized protein n=1 Tax=Gossypium barbadense TaxID=3634 RepID=A0A2P5XAQ4_GOSBA|nr:hypothetical protein GOBAR_AA20244 [Gossypium barbadense]
MELEDDESVETIVTLYCRNQIGHIELILLFDIDLNVPLVSENLNLGPCLQINLIMIETDAYGEYAYDNNDPSDHEVEDYSNYDIDEVSDDIDDESANDDGNKIYTDPTYCGCSRRELKLAPIAFAIMESENMKS